MAKKPKKKGKTPEVKTENGNQSTDLATVEESFDKLFGPCEDEETARWHRYWEGRIKGLSSYRAAIAAGFSESYARADLYRDLKPGGFALKKLGQILSKAPETARQITQLRMLTTGLAIDEKCLTEYLKDPKLAIERPQLLKHLRQVAQFLPKDAAANVAVNLDLNFLQEAMHAQFFDESKKLQVEPGPPGSPMATITIVDVESTAASEQKVLPEPAQRIEGPTVAPRPKSQLQEDREYVRDKNRRRFLP